MSGAETHGDVSFPGSGERGGAGAAFLTRPRLWFLVAACPEKVAGTARNESKLSPAPVLTAFRG